MRQHKTILQPLGYWLATGFGSGLLPKMPGTWGTLVGVFIYLLCQSAPLVLYTGVLLLATVFGSVICGQAAADLREHDHPSIVWDEMVGFGWTMWCAPLGWLWVLFGFLFFRLFDILKPWPICQLDQRVVGGFGIMLDDLVAALFAWCALHATYALWVAMGMGSVHDSL